MAASDRVIFEVPLLHFIGDLIGDFIAEAAGDDEDAVARYEDRSAKEQSLGDWLRSNRIGLNSLPLEKFSFIEIIWILTGSTSSRPLGPLTLHIRCNVDPH